MLTETWVLMQQQRLRQSQRCALAVFDRPSFISTLITRIDGARASSVSPAPAVYCRDVPRCATTFRQRPSTRGGLETGVIPTAPTAINRASLRRVGATRVDGVSVAVLTSCARRHRIGLLYLTGPAELILKGHR
jgi:hypothetical protein